MPIPDNSKKREKMWKLNLNTIPDIQYFGYICPEEATIYDTGTQKDRDI